MKADLADVVRQIAAEKYVVPARVNGRMEFSIAVKELMAEARARGISTVQRTPLFCNSIQTRGFREDNGLEITSVDGPAKKLSTTVVVHYRRTAAGGGEESPRPVETPEMRSRRLTERLRGLMKEEIAGHGGAEGYVRWVRGEDEEAA